MSNRLLCNAVFVCLGCGASVQQDSTSSRQSVADDPFAAASTMDATAESVDVSASRKPKIDVGQQRDALVALRKRGVVDYEIQPGVEEGNPGLMLDFENINPTDADLKCLSDIPDLRELDFGKMAKRMGPRDEQLTYLKDLTQLRRLCLNNTRVTDDGLVHIVRLRNLEYLDLSYTPVTFDALVPIVRSMSKLKWLYVEENEQITFEQVRELQRLRPGCEVVR